MSTIRPPAVQPASRLVWREGSFVVGPRTLPEETPVALAFDGSSHAVMMATPADLEDFAVGFALAEGIVAAPGDILDMDIVAAGEGIELRAWLRPERSQKLAERRRFLAGPTGCGLCGIESLSEALRPVPAVASSLSIAPETVLEALRSLAPAQKFNRLARAIHAAGFWRPGKGLVALREDVGRHNALDKLAGHLARSGQAAGQGLVVLTSRVSVEMVQKAAAMGAPILVAVSAPTALAVKIAEQAGITLIGVARDDGFEIFTHPGRIQQGGRENVA